MKNKFVEKVKIKDNPGRFSKLNEHLLHLSIKIMMLNLGAKAGQIKRMEITST